MFSPKRVPLIFSLSILTIAFTYRLQLTFGLFKSPIKPFDYHPCINPFRFVLFLLFYDMLLIPFGFFLSWGASFLWRRVSKGKGKWIGLSSGLILIHSLLLCFLLTHGAHLRLLFDAQTGLTAWTLKEAFLNLSFVDLFTFIQFKDLPFLTIPFFIFWILLLLSSSVWRWVARISLGGMLLCFVVSLPMFLFTPQKSMLPLEIRYNPVIFLLSDVVRDKIQTSFLTRRIKGGIEKKTNLVIHESRPGNSFEPIQLIPPKKERPWNILLFIMESVGTRYMFDHQDGKPIPMPFLYQLTKEGWYLKRHFTTSNISTKAIFSILSGRYDFFRQDHFGTRPDASIPSLQIFLGKGYDSFLVTPSPVPWYFPEPFVKNNGLKEIHHFGNLHFKIREEKHTLGRYLGRDELETFDFFTQRVKKGREPFLGIYISFVAHLPYFDYGEKFRIRGLDGKMISRYYNNLYLLDHLLRKMVGVLKETGLLERTILVVLGDHGQAFGQHHPDNFMHYRYSYNENLETPAFFYQPALFPSREIEFPTSHVDLLPTLLDALKIPYDPSLFDGESLFQNRLHRKYLFFYGHEGTLSSLSQDLIKVQYSAKKNRCWAFDLKNDPEEKIPLDCQSFEIQQEELLQFAQEHNEKLLRDNESIKEQIKLKKFE